MNIHQQFGSLSPLSMKTKKQDSTMDSPGAESSPPQKQLIDVARIITAFNTAYESRSVACSIDGDIWTRRKGSTTRLYNLQGNY